MEQQKWIIKQIFDGEYGCEELAPGQTPKVLVTLVNEYGEERYLSVEDDWLVKASVKFYSDNGK